MVGVKGGVRSLGLVAIVAAMLVGGVAAGNPCYEDCFGDCARSLCSWLLETPPCLAGCAAMCATGDTCKDSSSVMQTPGKTEAREQLNANYFCKLGCASSVCSAIASTPRPGSTADRVGEESVERCNNGCSEICTKRFSAAAVTA